MRFVNIKKLLLIPLFLISTSCFAQDRDRDQDFDRDQLFRIHINDFSKGQNSFDLSNIISANQGTNVQNVILNRRGRLSKRKGISLFAQDLSNIHWTGIGRFTPTTVNDYLMAASGVYIIRSTSAASWIIINRASPLTTDKNTEFIQADKLLVILNGTDYPTYYDGTTYTDEDFTGGVIGVASPPIAKYGSWFKNYLFLANGSVEKDWVWFSNNLEPTLFTEGDVFQVNTGDGQEILAMKPFKNNELIIYKERSVWLLDITGATPLVDWTLQPIIEDIGLIAPRSVASVGNDQLFLSSEPIGVRSLIRTNLDKIKTSLVSQPVQDIFDETGESDTVINRTHIDKAAAIFFDNKYLLAYPSGVSTVNDRVLIFDAITLAWYQIVGWFVEDWHIFDNKLYFIDSTDGRTLRAFHGNNDIASGPITTPVDEEGNIVASEAAVRGVDFHYESKAYNFDSPELYKILDSLEIVAESSGDYTMEVFINKDGGGWQSIGTMSLAGKSTNLPEDLPFTLSSEKLARKTFQTKRYGEFKEIQIGFDQSASDELVELRSYTPVATKRPYRRE